LSSRSGGFQSKTSEYSFLIFGILFCAGFGVVGLMHMRGALSYYTWTKVPCVMERFEIRDRPRGEKPFSPDLVYHYEWQGRPMTGTQLCSNDDSETSIYADIAELRRTLWKGGDGAQMYCRVNPSHPDVAALFPGMVHGGAIFFAAFGFAVGTILVGVFHAKLRGYDPGDRPAIILPLFLLFTLIGGSMIGSAVPGFIQYFNARHWAPATATVIWSRVGAHHGAKHTDYYPDIFYRYPFQGAEYRSNGYGPFGQMSSGWDASNRIGKAHPAGSTVTCFVNPEKPWQAVLDQGFDWSSLSVLFGVPFLALGLWGTYMILRITGVIEHTDAQGRRLRPLLPPLPARGR